MASPFDNGAIADHSSGKFGFFNISNVKDFHKANNGVYTYTPLMHLLSARIGLKKEISVLVYNHSTYFL